MRKWPVATDTREQQEDKCATAASDEAECTRVLFVWGWDADAHDERCTWRAVTRRARGGLAHAKGRCSMVKHLDRHHAQFFSVMPLLCGT
mmetsp:Transcript_87994/g.282412  ORF Transcript_87994/g.282412 Transcript_87994/m.282412 type:complete len:90 (-) Transcript_87994:8-277(-)